MTYKSIVFVLVLLTGLSASGCSGDKTSEKQVDQIGKLTNDLKDCNSNVAKLSQQVGQGKSAFKEENNISIVTVTIVFSLIFVGAIFYHIRQINQNRKIHEQEKNKLNIINNDLNKTIMELENNIKQLIHSLEEGEKNEVSTLIKTLKREREQKIQKIGGVEGA